MSIKIVLINFSKKKSPFGQSHQQFQKRGMNLYTKTITEIFTTPLHQYSCNTEHDISKGAKHIVHFTNLITTNATVEILPFEASC